MKRFVAVICAGALAAIGAFAFNGCQKNDAAETSGNNSRIAVVDLDKVATDLGWMNDLKGNLDELNKQLTTQLDHAKQQYVAQIQSKKLEFAPHDSDKLTAEQQQILQGMQQIAQQLLERLQQAGGTEFNNYRQQSILQYREAIRPIVQQVAEDKRLWYVSERNASVLYYDPDADVTDSVIDAARAHPPILTSVPLPQLPAPPTITVNLTTQPTTRTSSLGGATTEPSMSAP
jgi:Skp family chaperone for outer membrane proteins